MRSTIISLKLPTHASPATTVPKATEPPTTGPTPHSTATSTTPPTAGILTGAGPADQGGAAVSERGIGDLQLPAPIANLACSDGYVVLLGSATDPKTYPTDVLTLLQQFPGSSYLLTAASCSAFEQSVDGHQIYGVYLGPFPSRTKACDQRQRWPDAGYVKVLSNVSPDDALVEC